MFAINYEGLKKRETYDEIVEYIENKQDKIQYPDRTAKQLRNSPQLSNLLDGDNEGYEDMEEQQKRNTKEITKEIIMRDMASGNNETAQVLRAKAKTKNRGSNAYPVMKEMGSNAYPITNEQGTNPAPIMKEMGTNAIPKMREKGTNTPAETRNQGTDARVQTQFFDMTAGDNMEAQAMELDNMIEDQNIENTQILNIIQSHLGELPEHTVPFLQIEAGQTSQAIVEAKAKAKARSSSRKTYAETGNEEGPKRRGRSRAPSRNPIISQPASSSTDNQPASLTEDISGTGSTPVTKPKQPVKKEVKKDSKKSSRVSHGVPEDESRSISYWKNKSIQYIKNQLEDHHGVRFDPKDFLKGAKNKITKGDLLKIIKEKLGI